MNNIKHISHFFKLIFQAAFIFIPLFQLFFWLNAPYPFGENSIIVTKIIPAYLNVPDVLTLQTKMLGFLISCIPNGISMLTLYFLIRLFKLYEKAEIFSMQNVVYMKNIGYLLLASEIFNPIYQALMSFVLTRQNPPGSRQIYVNLRMSDLEFVAIAVIIILISFIMAEGCKMREEQEYII